ncbi:SUR7/PalI family-domain-containing protein [Mycena alexandri]|uniref:SUR7/PalI family-domain-containing protein n=1 Tax=Mycena alexandri TaxID=1745969 RepID=A0AAD6TEH4_9AGAR|nr:SUR7/PalI family-domain-containing protein [Mycena alexandri]
MGCMRPATPGFILTTAATALLAVVSFCVPYFKSIYFLKADISSGGASGTITFGTLGYCVELSSGTTCSKASVGYELDINSLVGNSLPIEIPNVVVKWLTYVLVLHIVALALAAGSAVFGLLAHVREMAMTCCSTFISGLAATVAFLAFVFDLAFFFLAKARINAVGTASIGNAIWLTLAAWILLFFSGCFYTLGRCCVSKRRQQQGNDWNRRGDAPMADGSEQMRLDAVKAEADRKARQKAGEGGLPAFHESQPLTTAAYDDGGAIYSDKPQTPAGYMQAPVGSRAIDQYYNNSGPSGGYNNAAAAYPPSPQRQYAPSAYAPSTYSYNSPQQQAPYPAQQYHSTPPLTHTPPQQYAPQHTLSPEPQQYAALGAAALGAAAIHQPAQAQSNPYLGVTGHAARGTSYHSAATHHGGEYSQYDPYDAAQTNSEYYTPQTQYPQSQYASHTQTPSHYSPQQMQADYAPRGDGYGANSVPPLETGGYFPQAVTSSDLSSQVSGSTSPKGPRNHRQSMHAVNSVEEEEPPQYDMGGSEHVPGAWGKS